MSTVQKVTLDFEFMCRFMIPLSQRPTYSVCDWRCGDGIQGLTLIRNGFNNVCLFSDDPDKMHQYCDSNKIHNVNVRNVNAGMLPNEIFDLIICSDFDWIIENKDWRNELDYLIEHLRVEGLMYIVSKNHQILHRIDEDNCIYVQRRGYDENGWPTIFEKIVDFEHGLKRFNYVNRQFAGDIQREVLRNCVFSLAEHKEPILVIGGPQGEMPFPVRVLTLNIEGQSDFGNIRADRQLPIADNSIGILQDCHVLEHCENTFATMTEWARILKPGGLMLHIVPDKRYHQHLMDENFKIGDRCFVQFSPDELLNIAKQVPNMEILQFDTKRNNFDMDLIMRKKK